MTQQQFIDTYLPLRSRMYATAFGLLREREEAQDVVQEVYARLWELNKAGKQVESPTAFALMSVRNACLSRLRERRVEMTGEEALLNLPAESTEALDTNLVLRLIDRLPEQQRRVMLLRADGLEAAQIAQQTGLSVANVYMLLSRARKKLKEEMGKGG